MKEPHACKSSKPVAAKAEWERWGRTDPLYGVAAWTGRRRDGPNPWTAQDFYELGGSDWSDFLSRWEKYGLEADSCLEIGCGAGRLTMHLANHFSRVHALDISDSMIACARQHVGKPNVTFHTANGRDLPLPEGSVSAVFSTHVFQHFDSLKVAERNFSEIARVLRSSGTMMIHLPIYRWPMSPGLFGMLYKCLRRMARARTAIRRVLMSWSLMGPIMGGVYYQIEYLYQTLPQFGFADIEISMFVTKSNNRPHSFVLARRSPSPAEPVERVANGT